MTVKGAVAPSRSEAKRLKAIEATRRPGSAIVRAAKQPEVDNDRAAFGRILREMREQRGLAQKFVALSIGVDPSYISRVEKGDLIPSQVLLVTLAAFYEVPLSVFGVVAGAVIDAKLTPAQEIAEYLLTELQKLVVELDLASEEIRGNKKLKSLVDSARRRADTFLIVVKRARGHALRRKVASRTAA